MRSGGWWFLFYTIMPWSFFLLKIPHTTQVGRIGKDIDHPAVFPPALPEFMYTVWTQQGVIVFEPFSGSGTSIIAAQRTGRIARAVEIAPAYVDVSLIRFGRLFPDVAITLKETGETFEAVAARRKAVEASMSKLQIEHWPVEKLRPYEHNPRKNDHVVNKMADALRQFGFRVPLLAKSDGELIDVHLRYKAALAMGMATVPVICADDMNDAKIRAFRILINRSATWADWDEELLLQELRALKLADFDLSATGFDDRELDQMLMDMSAGDKDPDDVPETPAVPLSKDGEIWLLGRHRLMCGYSTSQADARRLLNGQELDMIWTDQPYNVDYKGKAGKIKNDKLTAAEFEDFLISAFKIMHDSLRPGGAIYVAHSEAGDGMVFRRAFMAAQFKLAACLIWRKQTAVLGRGDYHFQHEPILYGWKRGSAHRWYGNRKQRSILEADLPGLREMEDGSWQFCIDCRVFRIQGEALAIEELPTSIIDVPRPSKSELHPTMKPVALIEKMLANSSPRGGIVGDFFGGSGSTLMACERMGRSARLMELDPKFVWTSLFAAGRNIPTWMPCANRTAKPTGNWKWKM